MRGNYYTGAPATAQQSQPRLQQMSSEPSANVGGPSRPCFRSVPAHRIVGGGLGRRYDHAARLSEYSLTSINEYLYHASSDVGDSSTRTDSGAGGGGRIGRVPVRLSRRDYFNNNNNDSYTSREGNRAEGDDDRLPNAGGDVVALEAPPPALVAAQPALEAARARRQAEVMRTRGGGEGEPPPPPPALEIPGGIGLELEIGAGCGGEGADGGRRAEGATLASLCLEAMAKSWESHSAVYLPRAYHMPHELCARLLRLLVSTRKLTAFSLSGFLNPAALELDLSGCSYVPKSVFKQLGFSCPRIIYVNLSMCSQVNNAVVRCVLQGCSALRQLYLDGCRQVTDAGFHLEQSPFYLLHGALSLETISVQGCPQVTGELVLHLRKVCRNLKELDVARCKSVGSATVRRVFESCPSLQSLNVSFLDGVVDEAFEGLPAVELVPSMSTAHQLQLAVPAAAWEGGARSFTSSVSSPSSRDSGRARKTTIYPAPTSSLPDLRHLNVGRCQGMTDLALARVAGAFPGLEGVHLEHCLGVTDAGVRALAVGCRGLRALGLRNCGQATDDALEALSIHCSSLEWLDFSWCGQITDRGVACLADGCPRLEEIQAVWCDGLTNASLLALSRSCKNLEALHVRGCGGITPSAVASLRRSGVEIFQ